MALMVLSSVAKRRRRSIQDDWEDNWSLKKDRGLKDNMGLREDWEDTWSRDWLEEELAGNN